MAPVSELAADETQHFDLPAHAIWQYRLDFDRHLPAYNPNVTEIALVTPGQGSGGDRGTGAVYHLRLTTGDASHPVTMTVTNVVQDEQVDATMEGERTAHETFTVAPDPGGTGCTATLKLWLDLPEGVEAGTPLAARILEGGRQQIRLELDGMYRNLQSDAAPSAG